MRILSKDMLAGSGVKIHHRIHKIKAQENQGRNFCSPLFVYLLPGHYTRLTYNTYLKKDKALTLHAGTEAEDQRNPVAALQRKIAQN